MSMHLLPHPTGILLFIATVQVSHPCLPLSGWLLTNIQVNIITTLHDMRHTCIYITLALIFIFFFLYIFYFPGQAGCPPLALSNTLVLRRKITFASVFTKIYQRFLTRKKLLNVSNIFFVFFPKKREESYVSEN
jgi:hypothetical protein